MTPPADRPAEAARLRAIHTPHRHEWVQIDRTIYAKSYTQPTIQVCLEDGMEREGLDRGMQLADVIAAPGSTIDDIEWLAGKLMVVAAKLRKDRMGPGDAHEMRHLLAAVEHGNSEECGPSGEHCTLDLLAREWVSRLHRSPEGWPR